ncbi:MAG: hypothetical protein SV062_01265 [Thermodesulfobacteriota bacterium]|nr:hypothetical protein [Thermodesulfobacteriota bacterium]
MAKRKKERAKGEITNILELWQDVFNHGKDRNFNEKWSDEARKRLAKENKEWPKSILKKLLKLPADQQKEFIHLLSTMELKENERHLSTLLESNGIPLRIKIDLNELLEKEGIKAGKVISDEARKIWETFDAYQKEDTKELKDEIFTEFKELDSFFRRSVIQDMALCAGPYFFKLLDEIDKKTGGFTEDEMDIIGRMKSKEAVDFLLNLLNDNKEPDYIKLIKKNLHRLRSSGFIFEIPDFEEKTRILKKASVNLPSHAFATSLDAFGGRILFLISPSFPRAQYDYITMSLSENDGIAQFKRIPFPAKKYKHLMQIIKRDKNFKFVEVAYSHALYLVEECCRKAFNNNASIDKELLEWREKQDEIEMEGYNHPVYNSLEDLPDNVFSGNFELENTGVLFELEEFLGWFLEPEETKNLINRLEEKPSPIIITPGQEDKKELPLPFTIASQYFTEDFRRRFQRRLEEMAYYFVLNDRIKDARYSLIAAMGFANHSLPVEMHPFAVEYIKRSLEVYREEQKKEKQKSLIVTPSSPDKLIISPEEFAKELER